MNFNRARRAASFLRFISGFLFLGCFTILAYSLTAPQYNVSGLTRSESEPLGAPPPAPGTGSYIFERETDDGSPVAYDPCRSIDYVVNFQSAPAGAEELLKKAFERVSEASGLTFTNLGSTEELPSDQRPSYDYALYGSRFSPVLVSWTDPESVPELSGPVLGLAGSTALITEDAAVYVTGAIELDGPEIADMLSREGGEARVVATLMHEIGHLVGLGHVDDPAELMYPSLTENSLTWGPGDLTGLSMLGGGSCFDGLDDPSRFQVSERHESTSSR